MDKRAFYITPPLLRMLQLLDDMLDKVKDFKNKYYVMYELFISANEKIENRIMINNKSPQELMNQMIAEVSEELEHHNKSLKQLSSTVDSQTYSFTRKYLEITHKDINYLLGFNYRDFHKIEDDILEKVAKVLDTNISNYFKQLNEQKELYDNQFK